MAIRSVHELARQKQRRRWPMVVVALVVWMGAWYFGIIHWAGR